MIFQPIINQSSNIVKAGDAIEIQVGVGAYFTQPAPKISINGKSIEIFTEEGFVKYQFKTPQKAGKYFIPVSIEYTDWIGKKQLKKSNVEYAVIK